MANHLDRAAIVHKLATRRLHKADLYERERISECHRFVIFWRRNPFERIKEEYDSLAAARDALPDFCKRHCVCKAGRQPMIYGLHPNGRDYFVPSNYYL